MPVGAPEPHRCTVDVKNAVFYADFPQADRLGEVLPGRLDAQFI